MKAEPDYPNFLRACYLVGTKMTQCWTEPRSELAGRHPPCLRHLYNLDLVAVEFEQGVPGPRDGRAVLLLLKAHELKDMFVIHAHTLKIAAKIEPKTQQRPSFLSLYALPRRERSASIHKGRRLAQHRWTDPRQTLRSSPRASAGAETYSVAEKMIWNKHIAAADGSPTLQGAAKTAGAPSLKGVLRFVFTSLHA